MSALLNYTLSLADTALILGHRNSEWCGHGPVLEQDIAISNISLDLIGQARNFYQYAAHLQGAGATEDSLAYLREVADFKNILLVEQPKGDWAYTIARQFFFSSFQYLLFQQLQESDDPQLAAIAGKSLKEVTYHLRWSSEWVIRLGDGTEESHLRMQKAAESQWEYSGAFFTAADFEKELAATGTAPDPAGFETGWRAQVELIFTEATLVVPDTEWNLATGKNGDHSIYLNAILDEMQELQRAHPGANW